jgi:tRNA threonylcarbamoyladenosine biosynthesis protein TsaB
MLLLVTDTSGRQGNVALVRAESGSSDNIRLIEASPLSGGAFSAQLVPQIAALLTKHQFTKADIHAFIVVAGPGSFTGLRVGLAAIKALSEILAKPIVPVSLLEVVAVACARDGKIEAVLDAGRGDIYAGQYEIAGGVARLLREQLFSKNELAAASEGFVIATPDPALATVARQSSLSVVEIPPVNAEIIARLGWRKLLAGETVAADVLDANYGRRSDAEIFVKGS